MPDLLDLPGRLGPLGMESPQEGDPRLAHASNERPRLHLVAEQGRGFQQPAVGGEASLGCVPVAGVWERKSPEVAWLGCFKQNPFRFGFPEREPVAPDLYFERISQRGKAHQSADSTLCKAHLQKPLPKLRQQLKTADPSALAHCEACERTGIHAGTASTRTCAPSTRPTAMRPPPKAHSMADPSPSFETRERSQRPSSLKRRHSSPETGRERTRSFCPQQADARLSGAGWGGVTASGTGTFWR
jgi:hypothetical protein